VTPNTGTLLEAGFSIEEFWEENRKTISLDPEKCSVSTTGRDEPSVDSIMDITESSVTLSSLTEADAVLSEGFTPVKSKKKQQPGRYRKIAYEEYFKIIAGRFLADVNELKTKPRVKIWPGDVKRLQDPVQSSLFRWEKFGIERPKNRIRFQDVSSPEVQMDFLSKHTHWGHYLSSLCFSETELEAAVKEEGSNEKVPTTARSLWKVLLHFLKGKPDPRWTNEFTGAVYSDPNEIRNKHSRASRLLEVLKTVDGVTVQRMCCFPHEQWTYEKYDQVVLELIWELISDEFLDGQLTENALTIRTRFSELKTARKLIKHSTLTKMESLGKHPHFNKKARWLRFLLPLHEEMRNESDRTRKLYLCGTLSQTRAAGKPPLLVSLQSKVKFLETVSIPDDISDTALAIIRAVMAEEVEALPDHIFTGLRTKASITVNANSCWEKTQSEAGTLATVQEFCRGRSKGDKAMVYDLETGKPSHLLPDDATAGEYIFWRALEEVLWLTTDERRDAHLVVLGEPGKARSITKTRACVKIVLDLVNKICAVPLEKGFASSHSGMKAAHHAWNTFKDFENEEFEDLLFSKEESVAREFTDYKLVSVIYKAVFITSTDYETATDFMSHKAGREIGSLWMLKCGIPKVLRSLVCEIAYGPRNIYFYGTMEKGELVDPQKNLRKIQSCRGVLMGDPLTKIVLHFTNIVTRSIANRLVGTPLLDRAFGPIEAIGTQAILKEIIDFT
jgi:hypothetical protein